MNLRTVVDDMIAVLTEAQTDMLAIWDRETWTNLAETIESVIDFIDNGPDEADVYERRSA